MRILNIARRFSQEDWGGTETVILESSRALIRAGHHVELYCTTATAKCAEENIEGIPVRRFPYFYPYIGLSREAKAALDKKGGSPFSFPLMNAIRKYPELDIIHLHTGNRLGGIGRHIAIKRGIPYFYSIHGGVFGVPEEEVSTWTAPAHGALEWGKALGWWVGSRRVLQDAAAVICVDRNETRLAQEHLPGTKVVHLPNGVDIERFRKGDGASFRAKYAIPAQARVLLTVARIDGQKNQQALVRMLPTVCRKHPQAHLLIVGNPTSEVYYQTLLEMAAESGLRQKITIIPGLPGAGQELMDAYHAANIFVLPSIHEPFGIVILEAWAAGLPVVATRVGGIPTFAEDGENALLIPPKDDDALADAVAIILKNPELGARLAATGYAKAAAQFGWDAIAGQLLELYEEALGKDGRPPLR